MSDARSSSTSRTSVAQRRAARLAEARRAARPRAASRGRQRGASWVDFPDPSPPSNTTQHARVGRRRSPERDDRARRALLDAVDDPVVHLAHHLVEVLLRRRRGAGRSAAPAPCRAARRAPAPSPRSAARRAAIICCAFVRSCSICCSSATRFASWSSASLARFTAWYSRALADQAAELLRLVLDHPCSSRRRGDHEALAAGEIELARALRRTAPCDADQLGGERRAARIHLQREQPARLRAPAPPRARARRSSPSPPPPLNSATDGLPVAHARGQRRRLVERNVRRVRHDRAQPALRHAARAASRGGTPPARAARRRRRSTFARATASASSETSVAMTRVERALARERQRDRAPSRCRRPPRSRHGCAARAPQHDLHQQLGLGTRDEHALVDVEREVPEGRAAGGILQRRARARRTAAARSARSHVGARHRLAARASWARSAARRAARRAARGPRARGSRAQRAARAAPAQLPTQRPDGASVAAADAARRRPRSSATEQLLLDVGELQRLDERLERCRPSRPAGRAS